MGFTFFVFVFLFFLFFFIFINLFYSILLYATNTQQTFEVRLSEVVVQVARLHP